MPKQQPKRSHTACVKKKPNHAYEPPNGRPARCVRSPGPKRPWFPTHAEAREILQGISELIRDPARLIKARAGLRQSYSSENIDTIRHMMIDVGALDEGTDERAFWAKVSPALFGDAWYTHALRTNTPGEARDQALLNLANCGMWMAKRGLSLFGTACPIHASCPWVIPHTSGHGAAFGGIFIGSLHRFQFRVLVALHCHAYERPVTAGKLLHCIYDRADDEKDHDELGAITGNLSAAIRGLRIRLERRLGPDASNLIEMPGRGHQWVKGGYVLRSSFSATS